MIARHARDSVSSDFGAGGDRACGLGTFLERQRATLVVESGPARGTEIALGQRRTIVGRGPGADLALDDPALARTHAALEYAPGGFRIRSLGPGRWIRVNGLEAAARALENGDRIQIGNQRLEFVLAEMPVRLRG